MPHKTGRTDQDILNRGDDENASRPVADGISAPLAGCKKRNQGNEEDDDNSREN